MNRYLIGLVLLSLALVVIVGLLPREEQAEKTSPSALPEAVAVRVGEEEILKADVDRRVETALTRMSSEPKGATRSDLRSYFARQAAERSMLAQALAAEKITVDGEALLAKLKANFKSEKSYRDFLTKSGLVEEDIRADLLWAKRFELLALKLVPDNSLSSSQIARIRATAPKRDGRTISKRQVYEVARAAAVHDLIQRSANSLGELLVFAPDYR